MFLQRRLNSICWGRPPDVVESFTNNKLVELCWELFWYYILGWLMYTAWGTTIGLFIGEYTEIHYLSLFSAWKIAFWWILFSFHQRVHGLCTRRTWHQVKGWNYESERKCICTQRPDLCNNSWNANSLLSALLLPSSFLLLLTRLLQQEDNVYLDSGPRRWPCLLNPPKCFVWLWALFESKKSLTRWPLMSLSLCFVFVT